MVKIYSLLFGIIASVSISLYSFMYILRNIYYYFENKSLRRFINKLLPFFSKYNSLLLVLALVSSILHILGIFINTPILNTGYAVFFILLLVTKFTFFGSKNSNNSYILNVLSYLLLFALVIHLKCKKEDLSLYKCPLSFLLLNIYFSYILHIIVVFLPY